LFTSTADQTYAFVPSFDLRTDKPWPIVCFDPGARRVPVELMKDAAENTATSLRVRTTLEMVQENPDRTVQAILQDTHARLSSMSVAFISPDFRRRAASPRACPSLRLAAGVS